eukprot:749-Heterococcus_DN1.PRE.2
MHQITQRDNIHYRRQPALLAAPEGGAQRHTTVTLPTSALIALLHQIYSNTDNMHNQRQTGTDGGTSRCSTMIHTTYTKYKRMKCTNASTILLMTTCTNTICMHTWRHQYGCTMLHC